MEGGGGGSPAAKASKFAAYQNPALSAALTANSIVPSKYAFVFIFALSSASALGLVALISWENGLVETMRSSNLPQEAAYVFTKALQTLTGLVFVASLFAIFKALTFYRGKNGACVKLLSKDTKDQLFLSNRQILLLGTKPKVDSVATESAKKPPKSKPQLSPSDILVPIHQPITSSNRKSQVGSDKSNAGSGNKMASFSTPSKSQSSPSSLYLVPGAGSPLRSTQSSPGIDSAVSTPWSSKRVSSMKEITTEEQLEHFLAAVDEQITESARTQATPPPTLRGFGANSPNTVASAASVSGTKRSTPLRPVRMSPNSQKFTTPPKKGEGDFPPSMSMEESIEAFKHLGIYPQIEQWRDRLRQWFSSVLLNPLVNKIETSHIQVMQAAAKLGVSITISQVGSDSQTSGAPATVSSIDRKEWQPAFTLDEDGLLQQLRATLLQALDSSMPKLPAASFQQTSQQNPMIPMMQECIDAITEHQRLHTLMKGEWAKGLLSHSNVTESYMVQRIHELAEGTCLKNYEYLGNGDVSERKKKNWSLELPTDSHLLLYLFCAFLEHPKWMLHVDPSSYAGGQSSKNPLFLGALPPKERFPEKYVSVIPVVPSTLHPGACVLVVGKQTPPVFALYWDKKLQFSLQGRTALWDSILLLCHRIKVGYGGIVRGMHLSSSALSILPVLDSETE
ncbi:Transmembrane protein 209 [Euphorbia peplus]|nr:Transmembrane protein 209 [Euphorbia peplus]